MNTPAQAVAFYKKQRDTGSKSWKGLCMKLARSAYGFDTGIYPSALACMVATPKKYRVTALKDVKVGMLGFFVDPDDDNPFEHIAACVGHNKEGLPIWGTNLADGSVAFVGHDFFELHWGDKFNFAASSLGTFVIDELQKEEKPERVKAKRIRKVIRELVKAQKAQRKQGHVRIADRLAKDIADLRKTLDLIDRT